jgi:hypothetical protein
MDTSVECEGTITIAELNRDRRGLRTAPTGQKAFLAPADNGVNQSYGHLMTSWLTIAPARRRRCSAGYVVDLAHSCAGCEHHGV